MGKKTSTFFNTYGEALAHALAEAGKKPVDLSNKLGIDEATISKYISGKLNPPKPGRQRNFEKFCGAKIKKQPDDMWAVSINEDIKKSAALGEKLESLPNANNVQGQSVDILLERIEYAEGVIRRARLELHRRLSDS